jgi:dipeptidyl aminopeptidase/acylaminoacyl peptidase
MLFVLGCKSSFTDVSKQVNSSSISLPESKHVYSATWLSDSTIVFVRSLEGKDFDHDYLVNPKSIVVNEELYLYDIETQKWERILLGNELNCHAQDVGLLKRLPNNKLGLLQTCRNSGRGVIREIDMLTKDTQILFDNHTYPNADVDVVMTYAFSPEMTELVQEDATGRFLDNQLYYIELGEKPKQIFSDFIRAMTPAWSPYNREIAFWGTENFHGDKDPDLKTSWDITGLATYPWDLYIASPEGGNVRILLSSIEDPAEISWSPTKNIIAFSGKFEKKDGLWLLDPVSLEITRIWNKRVGFSWSPDGTKIITTFVKQSLDNFPDIAIEEQSVKIIEVP